MAQTPYMSGGPNVPFVGVAIYSETTTIHAGHAEFWLGWPGFLVVWLEKDEPIWLGGPQGCSLRHLRLYVTAIPCDSDGGSTSASDQLSIPTTLRPCID